MVTVETIAMVFGCGILTEQDPKAALGYITAAMEKGDILAFLYWRDLLNGGLLPENDYDPPELIAADMGNPFAGFFWARRLLQILFSPEYVPTGEERTTAMRVIQWLYISAFRYEMPVAANMLVSIVQDIEQHRFANVTFSFSEVAPEAIKEAQVKEASQT